MQRWHESILVYRQRAECVHNMKELPPGDSSADCDAALRDILASLSDLFWMFWFILAERRCSKQQTETSW